jgi:hypothetical protein
VVDNVITPAHGCALDGIPDLKLTSSEVMMKTILMSASSINGQADAPRSSANHTDTSPTAPSHQLRVLTDDEMDKVAGGNGVGRVLQINGLRLGAIVDAD